MQFSIPLEARVSILSQYSRLLSGDEYPELILKYSIRTESRQVTTFRDIRTLRQHRDKYLTVGICSD